jgi:hypothetical protein
MAKFSCGWLSLHDGEKQKPNSALHSALGYWIHKFPQICNSIISLPICSTTHHTCKAILVISEPMIAVWG